MTEANKAARISEIKFLVELDENNIPLQIQWQATDSQHNELKECKSIMVSLWDGKDTMRIDLWTKDMRIDEMHAHFLQTLMTQAESFYKATKHESILKDMKAFCEKFIQSSEFLRGK